MARLPVVVETPAEGKKPFSELTTLELESLMKFNAAWPFESTQDAFVVAHQALLLHLNNILDAVNGVIAQAANKDEISDWKVTTLENAWAQLTKNIEYFARVQKKHLLPRLAERFDMPEDFPEVAVTDACKQIKGGLDRLGSAEPTDRLPQLKALQELLIQFKTELTDVLNTREAFLVPHIRHYFSHRELIPLFNKLVADSTHMDIAWWATPLEDKETKVKWMKLVLSIPKIVALKYNMPACKKYSKQFQIPIEQLKANQAPVKALWWRKLLPCMAPKVNDSGAVPASSAAPASDVSSKVESKATTADPEKKTAGGADEAGISTQVEPSAPSAPVEGTEEAPAQQEVELDKDKEGQAEGSKEELKGEEEVQKVEESDDKKAAHVPVPPLVAAGAT